MGRMNIMDCTLRDGGWVNQFQFGTETIRELPASLEETGIRYIELGYLDAKKGSLVGRSMYSGFEALEKNGLCEAQHHKAVRMVMIDYGKYPAEEIPEAGGKLSKAIDGIRLCFHKDALRNAVRMGKEILRKGYILFMQPMVTTRYSDEEIKRAVELIQEELPDLSAFYIVDSFGVMDTEEICKRLKLAEQCLSPNVALGLHTHNNRNMSFKNACEACRLLRETFHPDRILLMDSTLAGIGKGAGNLITEDFAAHLSGTGDLRYDAEKLRQISEERILPIRDYSSWGYAPEYEMTARYRATPTYATMLVGEYGFTLKGLEQFLIEMPEDKKDSFNRAYAEEYLRRR